MKRPQPRATTKVASGKSRSRHLPVPSRVARAARAIKTAVNAKKINYGAYSDKLPHLHMHLVPKFEGGIAWGAPFEMMPAHKQFLAERDYAALIQSIKAQL